MNRKGKTAWKENKYVNYQKIQGGGVQHCSDIQSRYPLQSNLKIDVIGLMVEDYFSENNNNKEQDCCRESYGKARDYIQTLNLSREHEREILDHICAHATDMETQGFVAGVRYGFSIWESLK